MSVTVYSDIEKTAEMIGRAGEWMRDSGKANYSEWWDPDKVSAAMLEEYARPEECRVFVVDGRPAIAAIIQSEQSLQDWTPVDGWHPPAAVYIHYIAVDRAFAGRGLVAEVVAEATWVADKEDITILRLDTDATESKLCRLYELLGFQRVGTAQEGDRQTAFYQKSLD